MIAVGCDHGGYDLKQEILRYLEEQNIEYADYGCYSRESVDYPVYARKVAEEVKDGACEKGILICGTGIGISIAANRIAGCLLYTSNGFSDPSSPSEHSLLRYGLSRY